MRSTAPTRVPRRASATTSRGPAGARPAVRRDGVRAALSQPWPTSRSACAAWGGRPPASHAPAANATSPMARATPGTAAARSTIATGRRGAGTTSTRSASSPSPIVTVGSARTTASAALRRPAPGAPSAPAMSRPVAHASVTASQIATNAPARVPRRARSVCSEMRSMSGPQSGQALGDVLGARCPELAGPPPPRHDHDPVGPRGRRRVVGDHDERAAGLVDRLPQQSQHSAARAGVERARGLVGEHDARLSDKRPGNRDTLLLAARELRRAVAAALLEPDAAEDVVDDRAGQAGAGEPRRERDVLLGREGGEQGEGLEDEPDAFAAQARERPFVEAAELLLVEPHATLRRPVQPGGELQQRRLAGARRPHDRGERAAGHGERDAVEGANLSVATPEDADDIVEVHHRVARVVRGRRMAGHGRDGRGGAGHVEAPSWGSAPAWATATPGAAGCGGHRGGPGGVAAPGPFG